MDTKTCLSRDRVVLQVRSQVRDQPGGQMRGCTSELVWAQVADRTWELVEDRVWRLVLQHTLVEATHEHEDKTVQEKRLGARPRGSVLPSFDEDRGAIPTPVPVSDEGADRGSGLDTD